MSNYDFHKLLEPLEFQELVCDIVQKRDGIFLERYKEGRDFGVDGFYTECDKRIIIQAKRYNNFKNLIYDLQYKELPKVQKLKPDRYILGISMDFDSPQKNKIAELFKGYIINTSDIISSKDINNYFKDPSYKHIELYYTKLWLSSMNVFEKTLKEIINRPVYKESAEELKEALKVSKVFVPTNIYRKALQNWSQNKVIILSGEPGVGKTTMAYFLALAYLQPINLDGFIWANKIDDVYRMWDDGKKQVIILDDFWGSIFYDEHNYRKAETRLEKLISRIIESNGSSRLILTTREYILQQGLYKLPTLKETLTKYSLICTMEQYSAAEKANILFRHLYASNLDFGLVNYLFEKSESIIYHENYSPRMLSLFFKKASANDYSYQDYFEELCAYFDCPGEFWKSVFMELSEEARIVAMILLISSTPMLLSDIEVCYQKYISISKDPLKVKNLYECIAELEKTMLKSYFNEEYETLFLKFTMPAVQDFLYSYIEKNSEQCIPLLLQCCSFYNQLQFLFEHQSMYCSKRILNMILEKCIVHYKEFDYSYLEYDGSWNWDMDVFGHSGCIDKFFDLLRCCEPQKHPTLFTFLETQIKEYSLTMGEGNLEEQYKDLHNFPDIIVRCINKGVSFDGKAIIEKYYEKAFSVYHYSAMKEFQKVFPEEYKIFYKTNFPIIKKDLKKTLLSEIEFLQDYCMDFELDMLLENTQNILKEFGLKYTKKFEQEIYNLCGWKLNPKEAQKMIPKPIQDYADKEEQALEAVKEAAEDWLFGTYEIFLTDKQILEIITKSHLNTELKKVLKNIIKTTEPYYLYTLLHSQASVELLITTLFDLDIVCIPNKESYLYLSMLWNIGRQNTDIVKKLIKFCAESFSTVMYEDEPVSRKNKFFKSEIFSRYLKNDPQLQEVVFDFLIIRDEQWVRLIHIPIYIYCFAFIIYSGKDFNDIEDYDPFGINFSKLRRKIRCTEGWNTIFHFADIECYHFKNIEWEGCMYRMVSEIAPTYFKQNYLIPNIKSYLEKLGSGDLDNKVLSHLKICNSEFEYDDKGKLCSSTYEMCDELCMIDHLSIVDGWDGMPEHETIVNINIIKKDTTICTHDNKRFKIHLYKIKDITLLKELGIYDKVSNFIKKLEEIISNSSF